MGLKGLGRGSFVQKSCNAPVKEIHSHNKELACKTQVLEVAKVLLPPSVVPPFELAFTIFHLCLVPGSRAV